jgi:hypothetical protein
MESSAQQARAAADRLFSSDSEGSVGDPLPIRAPDGSLAGWFVPVVARELLLGFFQFDPALTLLRYSRFPRPVAGSLWLDADTVRATAAARFPDLAPAGTAFLTYDSHVTRLVWAVPARGKTIFVAGDYAYIASEERDVTG